MVLILAESAICEYMLKSRWTVIFWLPQLFASWYSLIEVLRILHTKFTHMKNSIFSDSRGIMNRISLHAWSKCGYCSVIIRDGRGTGRENEVSILHDRMQAASHISVVSCWTCDPSSGILFNWCSDIRSVGGWTWTRGTYHILEFCFRQFLCLHFTFRISSCSYFLCRSKRKWYGFAKQFHRTYGPWPEKRT